MIAKTKQHLIISLVFLLGSLGAFVFFLLHIDSGSKTLTEQIEVLQLEQAQEANYIRLERLTEDTRTDREELRSYFLTQESDSIDFLNLVESYAPQYNVLLTTQGLETVNDSKTSSQWIEATFEFSGTQESLLAFLDALENVPYVSRVTRLDLNARSETTWSAVAVMRVRVLQYDR